MTIVRVDSNSPEQTFEIGRAIASQLRGGERVALCGPLGAGKTQLAKGIAAGLEAPSDEPVVSPTFVLVREYAGRLLLLHCDAYRLGSLAELDDLDIWELAARPDCVLLVEWADRFAEAASRFTLRIDLEHAGECTRVARLRAASVAAAPQLEAIADALVERLSPARVTREAAPSPDATR